MNGKRSPGDFSRCAVPGRGTLGQSLYGEVQNRIGRLIAGDYPSSIFAVTKGASKDVGASPPPRKRHAASTPLEEKRMTKVPGASHMGGHIGVVSLRVREIVTGALESKTCQSVLVVGAEGSGKTTAAELAISFLLEKRRVVDSSTPSSTKKSLHNQIVQKTSSNDPIPICGSKQPSFSVAPFVLKEDVALHKDAISCIRSMTAKLERYIYPQSRGRPQREEDHVMGGEDEAMEFSSDEDSASEDEDVTQPNPDRGEVVDHVLSYDSSHVLHILKELINQFASKQEGIVILLDNFDKLVLHGNGMGLYSLLDLMQYTVNIGMCVILTSSISDILQNRYFEKRIKSRFSMITLIVSPTESLEHYILPATEYACCVDPISFLNCLEEKSQRKVKEQTDENALQKQDENWNREQIIRLITEYNARFRAELLNNRKLLEVWDEDLKMCEHPRKFYYEALTIAESILKSNSPCIVSTAPGSLYGELSSIDHIVLCALTRLHVAEVVPKTFARMFNEILLFASKQKREIYHIEERVYRNAFIRLLQYKLIDIATHSTAPPRTDHFGLHLPCKFLDYFRYKQKLPEYNLPTAVQHWVNT